MADFAGGRASNFNPRSPHGERRGRRAQDGRRHAISTHAPRTGSDTAIARRLCWAAFQPTLPARGATWIGRTRIFFLAFQPTLPARGATKSSCHVHQGRSISTHAPRTGSDKMTFAAVCLVLFQPTLPARGATLPPCDGETIAQFQPTLPARGATPVKPIEPLMRSISTHAPRTGSDSCRSAPSASA